MAESYSIYKNHLKKNKQMTFIYSELSMLGSQLLSTAFHRLKEGSGVGKLDSLKNVWGGFRDILIGSCWHREVGGRARNGTSYVTGFRNISGFFCLVLSWKEVLKRGKLAIIDHSGPLATEAWFGLLEWMPPRLMDRSPIITFGLATVCSYIQPHSPTATPIPTSLVIFALERDCTIQRRGKSQVFTAQHCTVFSTVHCIMRSS